MKNMIKVLCLIAIVAVIGFSMVTCGGNDGTTNPDDGKTTNGKTLESIAITTPPSKTQYNIGDIGLVTIGMVVTATYSDDSTEAVSGYTIGNEFDTSTTGIKEITVTYHGKIAKFLVNVIDPSIPTVATPMINPAGGTVASGTIVTLTTLTEGSEIWYTTNGAIPAKNVSDSTKYTTPFAITPPVTIKAIAFKDGMNNSGELVAEFPATRITVADISITAPTKGAVPDATVSNPEQERFTAGTVTWLPNDNQFREKTEYTATVTLTAKSGFTFTGLIEPNAKINETSAAITNNKGVTVTLSHKFAATGEKSVSGITIITPPSNPSLNFTHGDALNLSGLKVMLTYDDGTTEDVAAADFSEKNITTVPPNGIPLEYSTYNNEPVTIKSGNSTVKIGDLIVNRKSITTITIDGIADQTYIGDAITPSLSIKHHVETGTTRILVLGDDYTVSYSNNTNAGTASITIIGIGDYTGNKTVNFTINKANSVTTWPTAAAITYGTALSVSTLSGGTATTAGTFAWTTLTTIPTVSNSGYSVTFTPTDTANYNIMTGTVSITVEPANLSGNIIISPSTSVDINTQLTATYSGSENVSYEWRRNTSILVGNYYVYIPTSVGIYTVTVSSTNYISKTSAPITVSTWIAASNKPIMTEICSIAYGVIGYDSIIVVGGGKKISFSNDNGRDWFDIDVSSVFGTDAGAIEAITFGNGKFVAGSKNGKMASLSTTNGGITWNIEASWNIENVFNDIFDSQSYLNAIAYGNGKFVASASKGQIASSTDGLRWKTIKVNSGSNTIAYGNGKFITCGTEILTSTDGETWTTVCYSPFSIDSIAYGNNMFVACGNDYKIAYSTDDGTTWTVVNVSNIFRHDLGVYTIAYGNGTFVAGGWEGKMATSTDGATWTAVANSTFGTDKIEVIFYCNYRFYAGGWKGKMAYSSGL